MSTLSTLSGTLSITCEPVPPAVLPILARQLRRFGARVEFESERAGVVKHLSGKLRFEHNGSARLHVAVIEECGHFPKSMLIGGIRQTVQEAVELARKAEMQ